MSEHTKALLRRVVDKAWNQGELEVVDELFAHDYVEHNPGAEQEPGIAGYIAILFTLHGTHDGQLMGIPASGQRVSSYWTAFARFQNGRSSKGGAYKTRSRCSSRSAHCRLGRPGEAPAAWSGRPL